MLTKSAPGMLCRSCLDGRRTKCLTCGSDISRLYDRCLYCHRAKVYESMKAELRKRSRGDDLAALSRRDAWMLERKAKGIDDAKEKAALLELVDELREWADELDQEAVADQAPVPIVDRQGQER